MNTITTLVTHHNNVNRLDTSHTLVHFYIHVTSTTQHNAYMYMHTYMYIYIPQFYSRQTKMASSTLSHLLFDMIHTPAGIEYQQAFCPTYMKLTGQTSCFVHTISNTDVIVVTHWYIGTCDNVNIIYMY